MPTSQSPCWQNLSVIDKNDIGMVILHRWVLPISLEPGGTAASEAVPSLIEVLNEPPDQHTFAVAAADALGLNQAYAD